MYRCISCGADGRLIIFCKIVFTPKMFVHLYKCSNCNPTQEECVNALQEFWPNKTYIIT